MLNRSIPRPVLRTVSLSALVALVLPLSMMTPSWAQYYGNNNYGNTTGASQTMAPLQGRVVSAPAGTVMQASLSSPVTSEYSRVGDRFTATLGSGVSGPSGLILPAGSQLDGQVVFVKPAGRGNRSGQIEVRFTNARTPNGQSIPISAKIRTEDGSGVIKGSSRAGSFGRAAVKTGVGAGLGAALGTAMGPLSGGSVGRGAIYGTAVGAGVGALAAIGSKGKEAVLPAGEPVEIVLDQAMSVAPSSGSYNGYNNYGNTNYGGGYNATQYGNTNTNTNTGSYGTNTYGNTNYNTQTNTQYNSQQGGGYTAPSYGGNGSSPYGY